MQNAKKNYLKLHGMLLLAIPINTIFSMEKQQQNIFKSKIFNKNKDLEKINLVQNKLKADLENNNNNNNNNNNIFKSEIKKKNLIENPKNNKINSISFSCIIHRYKQSQIQQKQSEIQQKQSQIIQNQQEEEENSVIFEGEKYIHSNIFLQQQQQQNQNKQQQSVESQLKEYRDEQKNQFIQFQQQKQNEQIQQQQYSQSQFFPQQNEQFQQLNQNQQYQSQHFEQEELYDQKSFVAQVSSIFFQQNQEQQQLKTFNISKLFENLSQQIRLSDQEIISTVGLIEILVAELSNTISGGNTKTIEQLQNNLNKNQNGIETEFVEQIKNLIKQELNYRTCTKNFSDWYNNDLNDMDSKSMLKKLYEYKTQGFNLSDHGYVSNTIKNIFDNYSTFQEALNKLQQEEQQQQYQLQQQQFQQYNQQQQQYQQINQQQQQSSFQFQNNQYQNQYPWQLQNNQFQNNNQYQQQFQQNNQQPQESQSVVMMDLGYSESTIYNNKCPICLNNFINKEENKQYFYCSHWICKNCCKQYFSRLNYNNISCHLCRKNISQDIIKLYKNQN